MNSDEEIQNMLKHLADEMIGIVVAYRLRPGDFFPSCLLGSLSFLSPPKLR